MSLRALALYLDNHFRAVTYRSLITKLRGKWMAPGIWHVVKNRLSTITSAYARPMTAPTQEQQTTSAQQFETEVLVHRTTSLQYGDPGPPVEPKRRRTVRFNDDVETQETYSKFEYDRDPAPEVNSTFYLFHNRHPCSHEAIARIRDEVRKYKLHEMEVHEGSKDNTALLQGTARKAVRVKLAEMASDAAAKPLPTQEVYTAEEGVEDRPDSIMSNDENGSNFASREFESVAMHSLLNRM